MNISDLIPRLHRLWEEHGDLEVRAYDYSDISPSPVETPEVETTAEGERYALVRP
ncbi:hypothetical protein WDH52_21270 [Streptomyces sp. TRM70308]|uniref:hypothetical protein n=1 Tax=Streptomyces sp. TRM70308 TaxID=3131932 RepID=UPI003D00E8D7